jgi:hypothetical protein
VERSGLISRRTNAARPRFMRFIVFLLFVSMLTQASVFAPQSATTIPPTPPSEKVLGQFGQWETEYWSDNGVLAFQYVGDPVPGAKSPEGHILQADFTITKTTLLTAIATVHMNPDVNAIHKENISPGNVFLVDDIGNYYGPYPTENTGSLVKDNKGAATVLWVAMVDHAELPPGHYLVIESEPSSTLRNAQTQGVPATIVKGVDAEAYANYMDALIAENEPDPVVQPIPDILGGNNNNTDPIPVKVTYTNPKKVVDNPPSPTLTAYPKNFPAFPCEFETTEPVMVTKIVTYHINNGKGDTPATIALQEHGGTWYGSWHAYGQAVNGIPNARWVVTPNFEIPAGAYTVKDATVSTQSADDDRRAFCVVNISPVVSTLLNNVTGKYFIGFSDDDGSTLDFSLVLAVIDNKKTLEIGTIVADQPFKFEAKVTERANGVVKAEVRQGFEGMKLVMLLTFKKSADKYVLTGRLILNAVGESAGINLAGSRTSPDLPGFIPKPPAGIGKVGSIPGPANASQAAAGIAFPTLATIIAAAAASAGGGGGGGHHHSSGGSEGDSGSDSGGSEGGGESDYGSGEAESTDGGSSESSEDSGGEGSAGPPSEGSSDSGSPVDTNPPPLTEPPSLVGPPPLEAPPQLEPPPPLDGQRMTIFDKSVGADRTYVFDSGSGKWINPITGGEYDRTYQDFTPKQNAETAAEAIAKAQTDANAEADGPTKWLTKMQQDADAKALKLADIQRARRAMYTIGSEGEGPISGADRLTKMEDDLISGRLSTDEVGAALDRQIKYTTDVQRGIAGTQSAADFAASQDNYVANAANAYYQVAKDSVDGSSLSGAAFRGTVGVITAGASEAVYVPLAVALKMNKNMDAGDGAVKAFLSAAAVEGATQAATAAAVYCGGAAIKGVVTGLGIKPSVTLPNMGKLLPEGAGNSTGSVKNAIGRAEAKTVEDIAVSNATYRRINRESIQKIENLQQNAVNNKLNPETLKDTLRDSNTKRTLQNSGNEPLKQSYNEALETQINKPAYDHTTQALNEKFGTITNPAQPGYKYTKLMDDGYKVEAGTVRTPKAGANTSVNADNDVGGWLVKRDSSGKVIDRVELPAHDVSTAHSEGFGKACDVYNPDTRSFNVTKANSELGIDFNDPKALTRGMNQDDLAKFGVNKDLSNMTPDKLRQLQLDRYSKGYDQGVPGVMGKEGARDFSTASTTMMKDGKIVGTPQQASILSMDGKGGLLDPQGLALMEKNKVATSWTNASTASNLDEAVRLKTEAMEGIRKMGETADKVVVGYAEKGVLPLDENLRKAVNIASDRSIGPDLRAQRIEALGVGDPVKLADKLSGYIEGAKMATGQK